MDDQKIENLLNLALEATLEEREESLNLSVGYDEELNTWDLIVKYNGDLSRLKKEGVEIVTLANEYAIVTIREELIPWLAAQTEIEYIEKPKRLVFSVDQGRSASCVNTVQSGTYQLKGQGILLAFLDSGIDYTHPDFRTPDGKTRIAAIWDQTVPGNPPEGYRIGTEYTRAEIDRALEEIQEGKSPQDALRTRDFSGHGTQVAGVGAGNGRASQGKYRGVAPESEILVVKLGVPRTDSFPRTTELMQAVDYSIKKAMELGLPLVINLSFGNVYGSHDGNSLLETYLDDMSNYWKTTIVVGTGNEGGTGGHTSGILQDRELLELELAIGDFETSVNLQLWKSYVDEFEVSLIHPSGQVLGPFQERLGSQRFLGGNTEILVYYGEPSPYSVAQEIYMDFLPQGRYVDSGVWKIRLLAKRTVDGRFDIWLPAIGELNQNTRFYKPNPDTTLTIPSTARNVISVGAYDSRLLIYAPFSGRGYTRDGRLVKPDLAAPGVDINTTNPGGGYTRVTGTSFATPFVSGGAALLMQWGIVQGNDPYLYGEKVKAYLRRGAKPLPGFTEYPNPQVGYGALCVRDSIPQ